MEPLRITAKLDTPVSMPSGALQFDAVLAAAVAKRDNIPPACTAAEMVPIDIPVQRSECGRFHLTTSSFQDAEIHHLRYTNRRMPVEQLQWMGDGKTKTVNLAAGAQKHFRVPMETMHVKGDRVQLWCVGDANEIRMLLTLVTHLGKRRAVGLGKVVSWTVEPCEPWPGFPCVSVEGDAMRNLPLDYPGLREFDVELTRVTYPYWLADRAECAVPVRKR